MKVLTVCFLLILCFGSVTGAGYLGWYVRGLQAEAVVGAEDTKSLKALQDETAALTNATRLLTEKLVNAKRNAEILGVELKHALVEAGLDKCVIPEQQQRVLSTDVQRYNEATGRKAPR